MGCGKSKHAVATASAPTAVARKKSAAKTSSSTGNASKNSREDEMPPLPDQNLSSDNNGNAAAVEAKQEAEPGKLISRESPRFFSSHKDAELIAAIIADVKSDDGYSEYGSPRTESAGRDDSMNGWSVRAGDEGEKAPVAAAVVEEAAAAAVVESKPPGTKQEMQNGDDRKVEEGKLESSSAEVSIGKAM